MMMMIERRHTADFASEPSVALPTLLTSRPRFARQGSPKRAAARKPLELSIELPGLEDEAPEEVAQPFSVKNTFVDYGSHRSPSLEPFFRERRVRSCPASPADEAREAARGAEPAVAAEAEAEAEAEAGAEGVRQQERAAAELEAEAEAEAEAGAEGVRQQERAAAELATHAWAEKGCAGDRTWSFDRPTRCPSFDDCARAFSYTEQEVSPFDAQSAQYCSFQMPAMNPYCGYAAPISPSMGAMCTPSSMGFGMSQFTSTTPMYGAQCPTPTNSNTVLSLADAISAPPSQPATFSLSAMLMGTRQLETARSAPGPPPCEPPSMMNSRPMMLAPASAPSAPPSAPPSGPALGCSELPSVGSTEHGAGVCKPCAFFHTAGCSNGVACQFCHLCDSEEKKRRRKDKIQVKRVAGKALRQADSLA
eukprot:CAMPEP_0204100846 /NCGR_PEP_ID=MMETSP0360-20130528/194176_1 /ASSEMBLY_ACC=CAM_ASM_000342 /TAXON_ID=268821 /ORGANISM="Scrippsiella Hangoei, Strain SHTV-5" /LENGTH=420 /DNA_ID=CAMNT_0051050245 /DNA_START=29 /DNA_END=1291 /DNA_ORIENTATION=+